MEAESIDDEDDVVSDQVRDLKEVRDCCREMKSVDGSSGRTGVQSNGSVELPAASLAFGVFFNTPPIL